MKTWILVFGQGQNLPAVTQTQHWQEELCLSAGQKKLGLFSSASFFKWHLLQYKEEYKFRNELKVFSGSVIGSCSQLEAELHQVCFPAEKSAAGLESIVGISGPKRIWALSLHITIFFPRANIIDIDIYIDIDITHERDTSGTFNLKAVQKKAVLGNKNRING